jgi:hypothetical protein
MLMLQAVRHHGAVLAAGAGNDYVVASFTTMLGEKPVKLVTSYPPINTVSLSFSVTAGATDPILIERDPGSLVGYDATHTKPNFSRLFSCLLIERICLSADALFDCIRP